MGVGDEAGRVVGVAEDDVGGFAADAGEFDELVHIVRHLAVVVICDGLAGGFDIFGLVAEEAGRFDVLFELLGGCLGVICGRAIFFEQVFGDDIDPLVGALGREDRGDQ